MARRIIDISVPLMAGIVSDPPHMLPQIEYMDHHATAPALAAFFGVPVSTLPDGEYAAMERVNISTHNGTHLDAPYHYFSSMNHALKPGGEPSIRIDEVPLDWCFQPAVKLDFRHFDDGYVVQPGDVEAELKRIGHTLAPLEIVVVNTRAGVRYGEPDFIDSGCGMGKAATLWAAGARHPTGGNGRVELGRALQPHQAQGTGNRGCRFDLGRPPCRAGDRLLAPRKAAQPRDPTCGRVRGRVLSGQGPSRLRRLDAGGGDPFRLRSPGGSTTST